MKTTRLLVCIIVGLVLVGCNEPTYLQKSQIVAESGLPNLGKGVALGAVVDVNSFKIELVLYEALGVVCIQHSALQYSKNCWDVDTAPKKIQELVKKHSQCDVGLSC